MKFFICFCEFNNCKVFFLSVYGYCLGHPEARFYCLASSLLVFCHATLTLGTDVHFQGEQECSHSYLGVLGVLATSEQLGGAGWPQGSGCPSHGHLGGHRHSARGYLEASCLVALS